MCVCVGAGGGGGCTSAAGLSLEPQTGEELCREMSPRCALHSPRCLPLHVNTDPQQRKEWKRKESEGKEEKGSGSRVCYLRRQRRGPAAHTAAAAAATGPSSDGRSAACEDLAGRSCCAFLLCKDPPPAPGTGRILPPVRPGGRQGASSGPPEPPRLLVLRLTVPPFTSGEHILCGRCMCFSFICFCLRTHFCGTGVLM